MSTLGVNFETYNRITGHCKNAYDKNRSSGGSSGGEGTALALKFSSLGIGSDIGGSIRIPCGW